MTVSVFAVGQPREHNRIDRLRSQFIMECPHLEAKIAFLLRNRKKKDGQKAIASYSSFLAPCMAATLFQFVG